MFDISNEIEDIIFKLGWNKTIDIDGNNIDDVNFEDTPDRVSNWLQENFTSKKSAIEGAKILAGKTFTTENNQMLVQGPIRSYSLCPHHLVTTEYDIWIGIVLQDKALGLSKYTRICEQLCKYPWLQEDLTNEIAKVLNDNLSCKGVIVMIEGVHYCMKMRGVKQQNANTVTSQITGVFLNPPKDKDPKGEFLSIMNMRKSDCSN